LRLGFVLEVEPVLRFGLVARREEEDQGNDADGTDEGADDLGERDEARFHGGWDVSRSRSRRKRLVSRARKRRGRGGGKPGPPGSAARGPGSAARESWESRRPSGRLGVCRSEGAQWSEPLRSPPWGSPKPLEFS